MKHVQLQKSIITDLTKKYPARWSAGRYGGRVALTDGYQLYLVNDKDLYINLDRLAELSDTAIDTIINADRAGDIQDLTYRSSHKGEGGAGAYDLYSCDGFEVAVNPAYLKYFEGFALKGAGEYGAVYVYEFDELVGLVMPIRRAK